ncbi:MAG: hypothetical protein LBN11_08295 [Tannerella sp.]|nr:hypothetical protein [Tannerella sp.]
MQSASLQESSSSPRNRLRNLNPTRHCKERSNLLITRHYKERSNLLITRHCEVRSNLCS